MSQIQLFTALKNADLAAMSAKEAIQHILGYAPLLKLRRYTLFELTASEKVSEAQKQLEVVLSQSYYLANPNKESYSFALPTVALEKDQFRVVVKVWPTRAKSESETLKKLQAKFGNVYQDIKRYQVWDMVVSGYANEGLAKADAEQKVILTKSQSQGILVNPLYESYAFLDA